MSTHSTSPQHLPLEQLLRREDLWRGFSHSAPSTPAVSTGHNELDAALLHGGWPRKALVEICQQRFQGEWQLFLPALHALDAGLVILLNPPAEPFSQALIQSGIDLDRLVVVNTTDKAQFIACFTELARTRGCGMILGWQPEQNFTYTELRKCLLASVEGDGLYALFRPDSAQQHSSPAPLRLFCQMMPEGLAVTVFKQKGWLQRHQPRPLILPLPDQWQPTPPYPNLGEDGQGQKPHQRSRAKVPEIPVAKLRGHP